MACYKRSADNTEEQTTYGRIATAHRWFSRIRQVAPFCIPSSTHLVQSTSAPYRCCPLLSRFKYIDRRTCPGMSWAGHSPSKLPLHVRRSGRPCNTWFLIPMPTRATSQTYLDRFSRFCRAHDRDRQTDRQIMHATPSVTIGHIYTVLRTYICGLLLPTE